MMEPNLRVLLSHGPKTGFGRAIGCLADLDWRDIGMAQVGQ